MTVRPFAAVLMSASMLAACEGEVGAEGAEGAEGDVASTDETTSRGSATASWEGGEMAFDSSSCEPIPGENIFTVNAYSPEQTIKVSFRDSEHPQEGDETPDNVTLEIQIERGMLVKRYVSEPETVELDSSGQDHARGRADMLPSNDTARMADPDGGRLEFDISC